MATIAGIATDQPAAFLKDRLLASFDAQSAYWRHAPDLKFVDGALLGAAYSKASERRGSAPQSFNDLLAVVDGRIDNGSELAASLGLRDPDKNDAVQLITRGWARWQEGLLQRLLGSFAFALFSSATCELVLARSCTGDRPLCYRHDALTLAFASMPSGLFGPMAQPSLDALARFMISGDFDLGETAFADIHAVQPGHVLKWSQGKVTVTRFWNPPAIDQTRTGDVTEEFRAIFNASVQCRIQDAKGPVATQLSGGLDSGAVTATAAQLLGGASVRAYCMKPAEVPLTSSSRYIADETDLARASAEQCGVELQIVSDRAPLLDGLHGYARFHQAPMFNAANYGWGLEIDNRAATAGAEILLSGSAGNGTFSFGGIDLLAEWLHAMNVKRYGREARALVRSGAARWRSVAFYPMADFMPSRVWNRLAGFRPQSAQELFVRSEWLGPRSDRRPWSQNPPSGVRRSQLSIYAGHDVGIFTRGAFGRTGVEERDPTSDQRLAEFCLSLPAGQYIADGRTRALARKALNGVLPPQVVNNERRGLQGADWFGKLQRTQIDEWLEEISGSSEVRSLIDIAELRRAAARLPKIAELPPGTLRHWGNRFTRALAVGAFIRECERDCQLIGRKS